MIENGADGRVACLIIRKALDKGQRGVPIVLPPFAHHSARELLLHQRIFAAGDQFTGVRDAMPRQLISDIT